MAVITGAEGGGGLTKQQMSDYQYALQEAWFAGRISDEQFIQSLASMFAQTGQSQTSATAEAARRLENLRTTKSSTAGSGTQVPEPPFGGASDGAVGPTGGALPGETMGPLPRKEVGGAVGPTGGSAVTGAGGSPVVASPQAGVPSPFESLSESSPFAAYLKRFALPGYGQSVYQDYLTRQYAPSFGTFQAANYLNPESPTDFNQFLSGGDPFGRGQARNLFSQALGQGPQGQQAFQDALGGDFNSFIGNVLRGRYAAPVAQRMAGWLPGMQQQFTAETGGQPAEGSGFLNFLKQHYGL